MLEIVERAHRDLSRPQRSTSTLRRGEILGLAGLVGSGRTELARAVFGIDPPLAARSRLDGEPIASRSPRDAIARGIYLVPEDRKRSGLLLDLSIAENISLPNLPAYAQRRRWSAGGARRRTPSSSGSGSTSSAPSVDDARSARCPAATSRRWCWPNGWR